MKNLLVVLITALVIGHNHGLLSQTNSPPDTLWIQGANCYFHGDPTEFFLISIPNTTNYYLRSELFFELLLNRDFELASVSPFFSLPSKKRPQDPFHISGMSDSLYFFGWENYRGISTFASTSKEVVCERKSEILSWELCRWGSQKAVGLGGQTIIPLLKRGNGIWWLYSPSRLITNKKGPFHDKFMKPFQIFEIRKQEREWKFRVLKNSNESMKISNAAIQCPEFLGSSFIAADEKGIWWADMKQEYSYLLNELGQKVDSLLMGSSRVDCDFGYDYDYSKSSPWNFYEMRSKTTFYGGLYLSKEYLTRLVWMGKEDHWNVLIHYFHQEKIFVLDLPSIKEITSIADDRIYLKGNRIGDKIAIPYLSIPKLIFEQGQ